MCGPEQGDAPAFGVLHSNLKAEFPLHVKVGTGHLN